MKLPKWFKNKRFLLPTIIIIVIALIIIVNNRDTSDNGEVKGDEITKVEVFEVVKQTELTSNVNLKGTIIPREFVRLRSFVAADVQYISPIGQQVYKGDTIARLSDSRVEDNYYNSLQGLGDSQNNLLQTQALNSESLVQAELGVNSAKSALQLAQDNFINIQQLVDQDIKSSQNSAEVTYQSAYNLIEQVLRFWSNGSLVEFALEDAIVANFELKRLTNEEFEFVIDDFNALQSSSDSNLVLSLSKIKPVLKRTKEFNDMIYRVLSYMVSGNNFSQAEIDLFNSQSVVFTTQLNTQSNAVNSALIALETIQVTSESSLNSAENQLAQAQIQYDNALAALESAKRQADIRELGAKSQLTGNRVQLSASQSQFEDLSLRAPFDGVIIAHLVSEGDQVNIGETIIEMGDITGVEIELSIDERSGDLIQIGQEVLINNKITGIIEEISPSASIETGKIKFTVVAGDTGTLVPGDVAEVAVELTYSLPEIIILPLNYVTVGQSESYVLVLEEGKVAKRNIKLSQVYDSHVEVTQGLNEGDQVIVTNGEFLNLGMEAEIKPR